VIVQGVASSGTRSTADFASEVGIDVFAVPGEVTESLSEAPNALIRDGAHLIRSAGDLLDDLGIERTERAVTPEGLAPMESLVFGVLDRPMVAEEVAGAAGVTLPVALGALMDLEMRGLIRGEGGRFRSTAEGAETGRLPEPR
jgi:DNA processing protein